MGICKKQIVGNVYTSQYLDLNEAIGKGSFGTVYSVRHKPTNRIYALKKISKLETIQYNAVQQVISQRIFLSELDTVFVPKLIAAYQEDDWLCLLMQNVEGITLRQCLVQQYPFAQRQGIIIAASLIKMLQHLESKKIIHRDLKPQNIIITPNGIRVVDFGIAKNKMQARPPGHLDTWVSFQPAPETLFRQNYDYTADYYSLGVIIRLCKYSPRSNTRYKSKPIGHHRQQNSLIICLLSGPLTGQGPRDHSSLDSTIGLKSMASGSNSTSQLSNWISPMSQRRKQSRTNRKAAQEPKPQRHDEKADEGSQVIRPLSISELVNQSVDVRLAQQTMRL